MTAKKQRVEKGQEKRHIFSRNASSDLMPPARLYLQLFKPPNNASYSESLKGLVH
jgi:hypothetical protein